MGDKVLKFGNFPDVEYTCSRQPTSEWRSLNAISLACTMDGPDVWKALFSCNAKVSPIVSEAGDRLTSYEN